MGSRKNNRIWEEVLKLYDAGEVDKLAEKYEVADMLCIGDDEKSDDKKDDAAEDDASDADTAKEVEQAIPTSLLLIMTASLQVQTSLGMKKRIQIPKTLQIQQKIHQQEMEKHWLYIIQLQEIQKMLLKR